MRKRLLSMAMALSMMVTSLPSNLIYAEEEIVETTNPSEEQPVEIQEETVEDEIEEEVVEQKFVSFNSSSSLSIQNNTVSVHVQAPAGVFPEGSTLHIQNVENNADIGLVESLRNASDISLGSYIVDVSIQDADGNTIQPDTQYGNVTITFGIQNMDSIASLQNAEIQDITTNLYHIHNGGIESLSVSNIGSDETMIGAQKVISSQISSFSHFVLDFVTQDTKEEEVQKIEETEQTSYQYDIENGNSTTLDAIIMALKEKGLPSDFTYSTALPSDYVALDGTVNVPVNKGSITIYIYNADKADDFIEVQVYAHTSTVTSTYEEAKFAVTWNDNKNSEGNRPEQEGVYVLKYAIDDGDILDMDTFNKETGLEIDDIELSMDTNTDTQWIFDINAELPKTYTRDGVEHTIVYYLEQKKDYEGYITDINRCEINDSTTSIMNSAKVDVSYNFEWKDGNQTDRPELTADMFEIYQIDPTTNEDPVLVEDVVLEMNDNTITVKGLRGYTETGIPYTYVIKVKEDALTEYEITYDEQEGLVNDAEYGEESIHAVLRGTTSFTYNKIWNDDNESNRPLPKLHLYVITEKEVSEDGTFDPTMGCVVSGYKAQNVPQENQEDIVVIDNLPLYNEKGERLVYYAYESDRENYIAKIDNSASNETEAVVNEFNEITKNGYTKYVLNNGTITNEKIETVTASATVTMNAGELVNSSKVTLQLQKYIDGQWIPVTYDEYVGDTDKEGNVVETLEGFKEELTSQDIESKPLPKKDGNGNEIIYRWVQSDITLSDTTKETQWDYDSIDMGNIGYDGTSVSVEGKSSLDTDTMHTDIVNHIQAPLNLTVRKEWYENKDGELINVTSEIDGYIEVKVLQNENEYKTIRITNENRIDDTWEYILDNLPRYDEKGNEYNYTVDEISASPNGYDMTLDYGSHIENDEKEIHANITNTKGEGNSVRLSVMKQWEDGNRVNTRKSMYAGIYNKENGKLVQIVELNASNGWFKEVSIDSDTTYEDGSRIDEEDLKDENFVIIEIGLGNTGEGQPLEEGMHYFNGRCYTQWDKDDISMLADIACAEDYKLAGKIATDEKDENGVFDYTYSVSAKKDTNPLGRVMYTWKNTRSGIVSIDLEKTWLDGGKARDAQFTLYANGQEVNTIQSDVEKDFYSVKEETSDKGTVKTVLIRDLPKYDENGEFIEYTLLESYIKNDKDQWIQVTDGKSLISGIQYESNCSQDTVNGTEYGQLHHSKDISYWKSTNKVVGSSVLDFNKVWYDKGEVNNRPLVSFTIKRLSTKFAYGNQTLQDALENGTISRQQLESILSENGETVEDDRFYDSDLYYWNISLGQQPYYDEEGYPYIYYATETMHTNASNWEIFHANMDANTLYPSRENDSQKDIYDMYQNEQTYNEYKGDTVLILSDGIHKDDTNNPFHYYSKTFVNRQVVKTKVTGRKVWTLPTGWSLPNNQYASVNLDLYRSVEPMGDSLEQWMENAEKAGTIHLKQTGKDTESDWYFKDYAYTIKNVDGVDAYGNKYYYYVVEDGAVSGYPEDSVEYNDNNVVNNKYSFNEERVEITGWKEWKIDSTKFTSTDEMLKTLKDATITLYAVAADENGEDIEGAEEIKIADLVLDVNQAKITSNTATLSYTFTKYTEYEGEPSIPYYGPNGQPFNFYVTESLINGYEQSANDETIHEQTRIKVSSLTKKGKVYRNTSNINFTNIYDGGEAQFQCKKVWADQYVNNDEYRPDELQYTIKRYTLDEQGNRIEDTWSDTVSLWKKDNTGKEVWTSNKMTYTKYDTQGRVYTYYVDCETAFTDGKEVGKASQKGDSVGSYYLESANGLTLTNTMDPTTSITYSKQWNFLNGNSEVTKLPWSEFVKLRDLGGLPDTVDYVVERSKDGENWSTVLASDVKDAQHITQKDGASILGYSINIKDMNSQQFITQFHLTGNNSITWEHLPSDYQYRVVEYLTWNDGKTVKHTNDEESHGVQSTIETVNKDGIYSTKATNVIKNKLVRFEKIWVDENNSDNTRPEYLKLTIQAKDGNALTYYMYPKDASNPIEMDPLTNYTSARNDFDHADETNSYYYSAAFYLPFYLADSISTVNQNFTFTEEFVKEDKTTDRVAQARYKTSDKSITYDADSNMYTVSFTNEELHPQKTISITTTKQWENEENWKDIVRPAIRYELEYLDPSDDKTWKSVGDDIGVFTNDKEAKAIITKKSDTDDYAYTWSTLAKYWNDSMCKSLKNNYRLTNGHPKLVQYRIKEVIVGENTSYTSKSNLNTFTFTDDTYTYKNSFTNTLKYQELTLNKQWTINGTDTTLTQKQVENLVNINALPEIIKVQIEYSINGTEWNKVLNGEVSLNTITGKCSQQFPSYDKEGNPIQYRIYESGYIYKDKTSIIPSYEDSNKQYGSITSSRVESFTMPSNVSKTLTNDYACIEKEASKTWDDEGNRDGKRSNFTFTLYRDGKEYSKTNSTSSSDASQFYTITKEDSTVTKIQWTLLPKYQNDSNNESIYTWTENAPNGYKASYYQENDTTYIWNGKKYVETNTSWMDTLNNAYQPERGSIQVEKIWNDMNNAFDTRTDSIYLKLQYLDGTKWKDVLQNTLITVNDKTLYRALDDEKVEESAYTTSNAGWITVTKDTWTYTWENLPVNSTKGQIQYRVIEGKKEGDSIVEVKDTLNGYKTSYQTVNVSNKNMTENTVENTLDTTKLTVTKQWENEEYASLTRPEKVTYEIQYKKGNGEWISLSKMDGVLIKDGKSYVEVSETDKWTKTLKNLPKQSLDGQEYQYKITEVSITYDEKSVIEVSKNQVGAYRIESTSSIGVDALSTTNTLVTGLFTVTKNWLDGNNRDDSRLDSIQVTLYRIQDGKEAEAVDTQTLNDTNNWTYTWDTLPVYDNDGKKESQYYVKESNETVGKNGTTYTVSYSNQVSLIENDTVSQTITNIYEPEVLEINAEKIWKDAESSTRPENIQFTLQYSLDGTEWKNVDKRVDDIKNADATEVCIASQDAFTQTLNKDKAKWRNVCAYVQVNGKKTAVQYRVIEEQVAGYNNQLTSDVIQYNGDKTYNVSLTNKRIEGTIIVNKKFTANGSTLSDDQVKELVDKGLLPETLKVTLSSEDYQTIEKNMVFDKEKGAYTEVSFENLPTKTKLGKDIVYSVSDEAEGYSIHCGSVDNIQLDTVNGNHVDLTNDYIYENVTVDKTWIDGNNRDGKRADSITVQLYQDDKEYGNPITLTEKDQWSYTWDMLPVYKAKDTKYTYSVKEKKVDLYTTTYSEGKTNSYSITNSYEPKVINVDATINWEDDANKNNVRPSSRDVTLQYSIDGGKTWLVLDSRTENLSKEDASKVYIASNDAYTQNTSGEENTWEKKAVWNNLPAYVNIDGKIITVQYRVVEDVPSSYVEKNNGISNVVSYNGKDTTYSTSLTNTLITGKLTVSKQFNMNDGSISTLSNEKMKELVQNGLLPKELEVYVIATVDKKEVVRTKTLKFDDTTESYGKVEFTDLPRVDAKGNVIVYKVYDQLKDMNASVECGEVSDITLNETTMAASTTLVNTYYAMCASATKTWKDGNNRDGKRPDSITVHLYQDDKEYKEATLNDKNDWKVEWNDLPVYSSYKDKKEYTYSIKEDAVKEYTVDYNPTKVSVNGIQTSYMNEITNTHNPELFTIIGQLDWEDDLNQYGLRPEQTEFTLQYYDGENWVDVPYVDEVPSSEKDTGKDVFTTSQQSQTITSNGQWKDTKWENLPVYANGEKIQYRIVEKNVPDGYSSMQVSKTIQGEYNETYTGTIKNTIKSKSFTVNKEWNPTYETLKKYGFNPEQVVVQLQYQDGNEWKDIPLRGSVTLTKANEWSYTWNQLPDNYAYRVIEIRVDDTKVDQTTNRVGYFDYSSTTENNQTTITNTIPDTKLTVNVDWQDGQNRDGFRKESVVMDLHMIDLDGNDVVIDTITLENGQWDYTWSQLPVYTSDGKEFAKYYVKEQQIGEYETTYSDSITFENALMASIDVTNTHESFMFDLEGNKVWNDDEDMYGLRDKEVSLTLEYSLDGKEWKQDIVQMNPEDRPSPKEDDGIVVYTSSDITQVVQRDDDGNWQHAIWNDLSAYALNEEGKSTLVQYRVIELESDIVASYTMTESENGSFDYDNQNVVPVLNVTNTLDDVVKVEATKEWDIGEDILHIDDVLPISITVQLQYQKDGNWVDVPANSEATMEHIKGMSYTTVSFERLRADLQYRIVEKSITYENGKTVNVQSEDGQEGTVGNFIYTSETILDEDVYRTTLTNTLPSTQLTIQKIWDDNNDTLKRRKPVTVNVYRDIEDASNKEDCLISTVVLSDENNWMYTLKQLPVYKNGSETEYSIYTVEEIEIDGYKPPEYSMNDISFDEEGKIDIQITNTVIPEDVLTGVEKDIDMWSSIFASSSILLTSMGYIEIKRRKQTRKN